MQNHMITQTASRQFQSAIVNNHAKHPVKEELPHNLEFFNDSKMKDVTNARKC